MLRDFCRRGRIMKRTNQLINKKLYIYILPSLIMSLSDRLGVILAGILAGNMISTLSLAAISICSPVLLFTMLIAWWLSNGCVIQTGTYLGKDKIEDAGHTVSVSVLASFVVGLVMAVLMFVLAHPVSLLLTHEGELQPMVESFLKVSMIGLPTESLYAVFVASLGVDNYPYLGMGMVLLTQVVSIAGDILILTFTKWGVAGIAFTTQLGYFLSLIFVIPYLKGKYRVLRFGFRVPEWRKYLGEILHAGLSNAVGNVISIKDILVNTVVVTVLGSELMSVYSVCLYGNFMERALSTGLTSVIALIGGILYGKRDYFGLREVTRKILIIGGALTFALFAAVEIRPQMIAALYGFKNAGLTASVATALRIYAFYFIFAFLEDFIQRYYPVIERSNIATAFEIMFNFAVMIPFSIIGVLAGGVNGLCIGIVLGGAASLLFTDLYRRISERKRGNDGRNIFVVGKASSKVIFDTTIKNTVPEASAVSERLISCCREAGFDTKDAYRIGLAAEEIAVSIALHGNKKTNRSDYIDISLSYTDGILILHMRDDGTPYNPVYSIQEKHLITDGMELAKAVVSKYSYQRILNLNNTFIELVPTV